MENGTSLDDILNGNEPEETNSQQEETSSQPRDEHGRFAPKESGEEQPREQQPPAQEGPPPSEQEQSHIPVAALKDERQKRQEAEQRLQQYEEYFRQLQQAGQSQQQEELPDPVSDPYAYAQWLSNAVSQQVMQQVQQTGNQYMGMTRAQVSEMMARSRHDDYDQMLGVFAEAINENPFLAQQAAQHPDPATFAYNAAKQWQQAKQFGSQAPVTREQIEAEMRQKIMAELNMPKPQVPTTLASEQSKGSRGGPEWSGPPSLKEILG